MTKREIRRIIDDLLDRQAQLGEMLAKQAKDSEDMQAEMWRNEEALLRWIEMLEVLEAE